MNRTVTKSHMHVTLINTSGVSIKCSNAIGSSNHVKFNITPFILDLGQLLYFIKLMHLNWHQLNNTVIQIDE